MTMSSVNGMPTLSAIGYIEAKDVSRRPNQTGKTPHPSVTTKRNQIPSKPPPHENYHIIHLQLTFGSSNQANMRTIIPLALAALLAPLTTADTDHTVLMSAVLYAENDCTGDYTTINFDDRNKDSSGHCYQIPGRSIKDFKNHAPTCWGGEVIAYTSDNCKDPHKGFLFWEDIKDDQAGACHTVLDQYNSVWLGCHQTVGPGRGVHM